MAIIKVVLVSKRELFLEGISRILVEYKNFNIVAKCHDEIQAVKESTDLKPDVLVLDTEGCKYIKVTEQIKERLDNTQVLILTFSEDDRDLFTALKMGARGYITKDCKVEEIIGAITAVHAGEVVISSRMANKLLEEFSVLENNKEKRKETFDLGLSKREGEVLSLLEKGYSNREIANSLFISENTTKVHLSSILKKLHVKNRQQAAIFTTRQHNIHTESRPDK